MGFALFTVSGTFNPNTYGLLPGDILHIKAVGGGGGGAGVTNASNTSSAYQGSNGTASSFGSILTAAGGLGGNCTSHTPTVVQDSSPGGIPCSFAMGTYTWYNMGSGGHGWHPLYGTPAAVLPAVMHLPNVFESSWPLTPARSEYTRTFYYRNMEFNYGYGVDADSISGVHTANTQPWGHAGGVNGYYNSADYRTLSVGGLGYGAGGGSGTVGNPAYASFGWGLGGNGGVIADIDYVLTSTTSIPITIGQGGNGAVSNGGGGANGCVAIWW